MQVDSKLIELLAKLAKLELTEQEKNKIAKQFPDIIEYISNIKSFDTQGAKPVYHTNISQVVLRDDKKDSSRALSRKQALANAKRTRDGYFVVDAILD